MVRQEQTLPDGGHLVDYPNLASPFLNLWREACYWFKGPERLLGLSQSNPHHGHRHADTIAIQNQQDAGLVHFTG